MKEAVVFIIDAGSSMSAPMEVNGKAKLEAAKEAVTSMVSDLMLQSIQNELCVIVCKTRGTRHHKLAAGMDIEEEEEDDIPFPNLTELTNGVTRPSSEVLRRIQEISVADGADELRGDFCDAIVLAADALYERTNKKRYQRKIVLVTDAGHDVVMDAQQTLEVIDSLRSMECQIEVIGINFTSSVVYEEPLKVKKEEDFDDVDVKTGVGVGLEESVEAEDEDCEYVYTSKEDRESLLISLTEKTGGRVIAVKTLQNMLEINKGKRLQTATKRKMELRIAPGVIVDARYLLMMKKEGYPTLKTEVYIIDEETNEVVTGNEGELLTDKVSTVVQYIDEITPEEVVDDQERTTAIRYGVDLIPMSEFDYQGLQKIEDCSPRIEILGYVDRGKIPDIYLMGPPYAISGNDSRKSCAAIAALAQALERLQKSAICTFFKTKMSADHLLGALFPLQQELAHPVHLVFLQLPFAGDVRNLTMDSFERLLNDESRSQKEMISDNLIDSMMLDAGALQSGSVPSPFLRGWNQTKVERLLNKRNPIVSFRAKNDPMSVRASQKSKDLASAFHKMYNIKKEQQIDQKKNARQGRSRVFTYKDYLIEKDSN